jgi:hypothetical protein
MKMVLAGGMASSGQILRTETMAEMLRPQNADVPMDLDFCIGLAWMLDEIAGLPTVGHNGDAMCYHSSLLILPEEKLGVFVTSGSDESLSLVRTLASTTLKRAFEVKTGKVEQAPANKPEKTVQLSVADLENIPGFYATETGLAKVTAHKNNL